MSACRQTGAWTKMTALAQRRAFSTSRRCSQVTFDNVASLAPQPATIFYRQSGVLTTSILQSSTKGTDSSSSWSIALIASGALLANQFVQDKGLRQPVAAEAGENPLSSSSVLMATSSSSSEQDLEKLKADWDEFHLEALMYNDDDDDEEEEEEEDKEEESEDDESEENKEAGYTVTDDVANTEGDASEEVDPLDQGLDKELYPDDFSDLPEVEEDTTCSICLINREGPCRNPWLRFEKCIKVNPLKDDAENAKEESGDGEGSTAQVSRQCDHLFKPWFTCFSQHRITYSMITNKQVKEEMDFIEEMHGTETVPSLLEAKLDTNDIQEMKMEPSLDKPYVQRYIKFPLHNPATGNTIRVAYARDNEGNVLGFDYFKTELEDNKTEGDMMFHMPHDTASVTAYAYYTSPSPPPEESALVTEGVTEEDDNSKDVNQTKKEEDTSSTSGEKELDPLVVNEKVYFQHINLEIAPKSPKENDASEKKPPKESEELEEKVTDTSA